MPKNDRELVMAMKALLTGSHAYGEPNKKSDVDIVVLCNRETAILLNNLLRPDSYFHMSHPSVDNSIRQGKINLIIEHEKKAFDVWVDGIEQLKARKPVTRDEAVETFKKLRKERGVNLSA